MNWIEDKIGNYQHGYLPKRNGADALLGVMDILDGKWGVAEFDLTKCFNNFNLDHMIRVGKIYGIPGELMEEIAGFNK